MGLGRYYFVAEDDDKKETALAVPDMNVQFSNIQKMELGDIIVRLVIDGSEFDEIAEALTKGTGLYFSPAAVAKFCRKNQKLWNQAVDAFIEGVRANQLNKITLQMSKFYDDLYEIAQQAKDRYIAGAIDERQLAAIISEQRKFISLNMERLGLKGQRPSPPPKIDVKLEVDSKDLLGKMRTMIGEEKRKKLDEDADDVDYEVLDDDDDALLDV